jgi:uncharacterized membrane protein
MMLIAPPASLVRLLEPWTQLYNDSKLVETLVMFGHVGGLVVAGGLAIATDRGTLRAAPWSDVARKHHLDELSVLHRTVITALAVTLASGLLLFAADIETFWASWIFWVKMALVVMLLANGARMKGVETRLRVDSSAGSPHWASLRTSARASLTLWLTIAFAGVALLNYA